MHPVKQTFRMVIYTVYSSVSNSWDWGLGNILELYMLFHTEVLASTNTWVHYLVGFYGGTQLHYFIAIHTRVKNCADMDQHG